MISIVISDEEYMELLRLLPEIVPDLKFTLMIKDDNLQELGFVKSAPCTVNFDIDAEGFEKILDMLMDIETAAYNLSEEEEDSTEFKKYQRYKNLWGILYNAKQLQFCVICFDKEVVPVIKKTKSGEKEIDIKPHIKLSKLEYKEGRY